MPEYSSRRVPWLILVILLSALTLVFLPASAASPLPSGKAAPRANAANPFTYTVFLPMVGAPCPTLPAETYSSLTILGHPTDRPAEKHPDLNLAVRGFVRTTGYLGLVDLVGPTDPNAPQLYRLFGDRRTGVFLTLSQVYDWNWATNTRGEPIADPPVTLAGLQVKPGEAIHVPDSGYNIGTSSYMPRLGVETDDHSLTAATGYEVLVLYAAPNRITLKYTREDNVVYGYTLHVEGICVEPRLLALYEQWNRAGRWQLPALRAGQSFGTAAGTELGVAIRDTGQFLDPRSRKDWWRGR